MTTLGISAGGFLLQYAIGIRAFYLTLQIVDTVVAAYILVALISLAVNLVRAPALRDRERQAKIGSLAHDLGRKLSQEEIINQLIEFSEEGHEQLQRCKYEYFQEYQTEADKWGTKVSEYLEKTLGKPFGSRFRNSLIRSTLYQYSSTQHRALYDGLYVKLETLTKIIEGLQSGQSTFSLQSADVSGTVRRLSVEAMTGLLALAGEWSKLHESFLSGVSGGAESRVSDLMSRTEAFLRQELDEVHAAMVKNAPPEHPDLHGRATRDKHFIGLAAAKLKNVNQIIEEQRRVNRTRLMPPLSKSSVRCIVHTSTESNSTGCASTLQSTSLI